jgi:hypothetical protein
MAIFQIEKPDRKPLTSVKKHETKVPYHRTWSKLLR